MKNITLIALVFIFVNSLFAAPSYNTTTDACYKNREIVYPLQEVFDALKQTLMQSNLNIVTVTKNDGILTAKGSTYNDDEETITAVTMTVDFKERDNGITSVKVIASYETQEKKSDSGQLGGAGISLPIPVPFTGKYTMTSSGNIDDSLWYQGFFSSLEKILFENHMKYGTKDPVIEKTEVQKIDETVSSELDKTEAKIEAVATKETPIETTPAPVDETVKPAETTPAPPVEETTTPAEAAPAVTTTVTETAPVEAVTTTPNQ